MKNDNGFGLNFNADYNNVKNKALDELNEPSLKTKAINYTGALLNWAFHGFPKRSADEIAILYEICQKCEFNKNDSCSLCGCKTNLASLPIKNKLAMKTETCPKNKW